MDKLEAIDQKLDHLISLMTMLLDGVMAEDDDDETLYALDGTPYAGERDQDQAL